MSEMDDEKQPTEVFKKKVFLKNSQNWQENTCVRLSFLINLQASACSSIEKEALVQVIFFCECYEISFLQNTFGLQLCKRRYFQIFPWEFAKFFRALFYGSAPDEYFWNTHNFFIIGQVKSSY